MKLQDQLNQASLFGTQPQPTPKPTPPITVQLCSNCYQPGCPGLIDHCETGYKVFYCTTQKASGKGQLSLSPKQTATGKGISNPLMVVHLSKMQPITPDQFQKSRRAKQIADDISKEIHKDSLLFPFHQPETSNQNEELRKTLEGIEENQNILKLLFQSSKEIPQSSHIFSTSDTEDTATSRKN